MSAGSSPTGTQTSHPEREALRLGLGELCQVHGPPLFIPPPPPLLPSLCSVLRVSLASYLPKPVYQSQ